MIGVTEFILWIVVAINGYGVSQQAALFPSYKACNDAKVQMTKALEASNISLRRVAAECLPRFPEK